MVPSTHPTSLYPGPARAPRRRPRGAASTFTVLRTQCGATSSKAARTSNLQSALRGVRHRATVRSTGGKPRDGDGCPARACPNSLPEGSWPHLINAAPKECAESAPLNLCLPYSRRKLRRACDCNVAGVRKAPLWSSQWPRIGIAVPGSRNMRPSESFSHRSRSCGAR